MKLHFIRCPCGKEVEQKVSRQIYCSIKCKYHYWNKTPKGKANSKRQYEQSKLRGTAYYTTAKGKANNLKRSKKYRLLHLDEVREYKKLKAREYCDKRRKINGTIYTAEETRKNRENHLRLNQRLVRQSIKGSLGSKTELNEQDINALEKDVKQLQEKIGKLVIQLSN